MEAPVHNTQHVSHSSQGCRLRMVGENGEGGEGFLTCFGHVVACVGVGVTCKRDT